MIVEKLINYYKRMIDVYNKIYKVYFNNQTLLKMVYVMLLMLDQKRLQRI